MRITQFKSIDSHQNLFSMFVEFYLLNINISKYQDIISSFKIKKK